MGKRRARSRADKVGRYIRTITVGDGYEVARDYCYYSARYNRCLTIRRGFYSDGATKAFDIKNTDAWLIHDHICRYARWDDGTPIDNWTASTVLADIMRRDGYTFRAFWWWLATWLAGGGAARKNGLFVSP